MALLTQDYYCPAIGMATELRVLAPDSIFRGEEKPHGTLLLLPPQGEGGLALLTRTKIAGLCEDNRIAAVIPACLEGCYTDMVYGYPFYKSLKFVREYLGTYLPAFALLQGKCAIAGVGIGGAAALRWASEEPDFFSCAGAIGGLFDPNKLPKDYFTEKRLENLYGSKENRDKLYADFLSTMSASKLKRVFLFTAQEDEGCASTKELANALGDRAALKVVPGEAGGKTRSDAIGAFVDFFLGGEA